MNAYRTPRQIHRLLALALCTTMLASCGILTRTQAPTAYDDEETEGRDLLLIGTYTDGNSDGIYSFSLDAANLKANHVGSFITDNPSFLSLDRRNSRLYIVNENKKQPAITSAQVDLTSGELKKINQTPTLGADPTYIAQRGNYLTTANYSGGTITLVKVDADGTLGKPDWRIELGKAGVSHPHSTVFTPNGNHLFVTDLGLDKIFHFRVHSTNPPLTIDNRNTSLTKGSGPRHIIFDKSGKHAYVICELEPKVLVYSHNNGVLEQIQEVTVSGVNKKGGAHIALSKDGKFLYTSHRDGGDGIAIFSVTPESGTLTQVSFQTTPKYPRHFAISPDNKYLAVACRDNNSVELFSRDLSSGLLHKLNVEIKLSHPAFILWTKAAK